MNSHSSWTIEKRQFGQTSHHVSKQFVAVLVDLLWFGVMLGTSLSFLVLYKILLCQHTCFQNKGNKKKKIVSTIFAREVKLWNYIYTLREDVEFRWYITKFTKQVWMRVLGVYRLERKGETTWRWFTPMCLDWQQWFGNTKCTYQIMLWNQIGCLKRRRTEYSAGV